MTSSKLSIFLGTYDGRVIKLMGNPSYLSLKAENQVSTNSIRALALTQNHLLSGGFDQELRILGLGNCQEVKESKQLNGVVNTIHAINNQLLAVGINDGTISFFDVGSWAFKKSARLHKKPVEAMCCDAKNIVLLSGAKNRVVLWKVASQQKMRSYRFPYQHIVVSKDFSRLILGTSNEIHEIDMETNQETQVQEIPEKVQTMALFQSFLIVGTQNGNVQFWPVGQYQHKLHFQAHTARVKAIAILQDEDTHYLVTVSSNGEVKVWDVLELIKEVENLSQDYPLTELKPLFQAVISCRITCLAASIQSSLPSSTAEKQSKKTKPISKNGTKKQKKQKQKKEHNQEEQ